jgi:hypothetical protein
MGRLCGAITKLSLHSTVLLFHSVYYTPLSACAIIPPWCKEAPMEGYVSEWRNSPRVRFPLGIQLDQLSFSDSEIMQEFLLPLIPTE